MNEIYILRVLLKRELYIKYRKYIDVKEPSDVVKLYQLLDKLHSELQRDITVQEFCMFSDREQLDYKDQLLDVSVEDNAIEKLLTEWSYRQWAYEHAKVAVEVYEGRKDMLSLQEHALTIPKEETLIKTPWVTDSVEELKQAVDRSNGLRWRLPSIQNTLGCLRKGDFGFIFARPETGKTTFLATNVTYFAGQADNPVIWLNNEEEGRKVKSRLMQSALQMPYDRFMSIESNKIEEEYLKRTNGMLKLGDFAVLHRRDVERILQEENPSLLVIDQIDKIKGFKSDKREVMLGELYLWAREMAKTYCPIIGVCQASSSAENKKWLTMDDVAESKTSKAAEGDFIIGIGKVHDENYESLRFLHFIKNKLTGRHDKITCRILPEIARYEDI